MATPFVAGGAALLLATRGKSTATAKTARTLFETTASKISTSKTDGDLYQTLSQSGAGLINVYKAIHSTQCTAAIDIVSSHTFTVQRLPRLTN